VSRFIPPSTSRLPYSRRRSWKPRDLDGVLTLTDLVAEDEGIQPEVFAIRSGLPHFEDGSEWRTHRNRASGVGFGVLGSQRERFLLPACVAPNVLPLER
jgi:hypothetical protein